MARERGGIPSETLMGLRRCLAALPRHDSGRLAAVGRIAELFGVSSSTVYRALASVRHPKGLRRADRGRPCAAEAISLARVADEPVLHNSLDAKLARIGYTPKALAERFDAHPAEIRRFLNRGLDSEPTAELGAALRDAGIPS